MLDDVPRQMRFLANRLGVDARVIEEPAKELSGRVSSAKIPQLLRELEYTLGGDVNDPDPVAAVLASNMISVGVDISRLGLMVVNGQPKTTAEYIQSTSRVGRGLPGLVYTVYNFGRPRDVSHFEHFLSYHSALYRAVEATSVTPWAPRARDKALHAALTSLVRHLVPGMLADHDAAKFDPQNAQVRGDPAIPGRPGGVHVRHARARGRRGRPGGARGRLGETGRGRRRAAVLEEASIRSPG